MGRSPGLGWNRFEIQTWILSGDDMPRAVKIKVCWSSGKKFSNGSHVSCSGGNVAFRSPVMEGLSKVIEDLNDRFSRRRIKS